MRHSWQGALALAVLVAWGTGVRADHLVPEAGASHLLLLRQKSVQEELRLSADQVKKINDFADKQWKKAQDVIKLDAKDRHEKWDKMNEENEHFLHDTLKPEQHKRLHQIGLQVAGLAWLTHPDVARELKLTDEQKKKIRHEQQDAGKEMEELLYSTKPEQRKDKYQTFCQACAERVNKLLTDEQKAKLKEMKGEPFKGELRIEYPEPEKRP